MNAFDFLHKAWQQLYGRCPEIYTAKNNYEEQDILMAQQMVEPYILNISPTALHFESQTVTDIFIIVLFLVNTTFTKGSLLLI